MLSIIIPVHNERAILETAVRALDARLKMHAFSYEIVLVENGSADGTYALASELSSQLEHVRVFHEPQANYGRALKRGIREARGDVVICDEIDLCDVGFYQRALALLGPQTDMVIGSKRLPESLDSRPLHRRVGTTVINGILRLAVGFQGTDTHGLKAFRKEAVLPLLNTCTVEHNIFASELVVRAVRAGLVVREIPVQVVEMRPPSMGLLRRVPKALWNLARLTYALRGRTGQ